MGVFWPCSMRHRWPGPARRLARVLAFSSAKIDNDTMERLEIVYDVQVGLFVKDCDKSYYSFFFHQVTTELNHCGSNPKI